MTNNKPAFVATVVVAILAVAAVVFVLWKTAQDELEITEKEDELVPSYFPSDEVLEEMKDAVEVLIKNNYTVVKLYYTRGLPYEEEPYGNRPEGGYYYAVSDEYSSLEEIESIVDATFFEGEAARIKSDPGGDGPVYALRDGRLAINEKFKPDTEYAVDWSSPSYSIIEAKSDTECVVEITLQYNDGDEILSVSDRRTMMKLNGEWKLDNILL